MDHEHPMYCYRGSIYFVNVDNRGMFQSTGTVRSPGGFFLSPFQRNIDGAHQYAKRAIDLKLN